MPSPKHLWSGDWERESAAAAAARDASERPAAPARPAPVDPAPPEPLPPPRPRVTPRPARPTPSPGSWLGRRVLLVSILGALVLVGTVWALSSGGNTSTASQGGGGQPYLGMNLQSVPVDRVLVQSVVPGSPADQAGIGPGDLLLSVDGHAVSSPGDVYHILSGLQPGDAVTLRLQQGPVSITAQVQLAAGGP